MPFLNFAFKSDCSDALSPFRLFSHFLSRSVEIVSWIFFWTRSECLVRIVSKDAVQELTVNPIATIEEYAVSDAANHDQKSPIPGPVVKLENKASRHRKAAR